MKQNIKEIIKKNLPEKKEKVYRSDGKTELFITSNFHFNQALSQINTSLIADEVLKVVVEKIKNYKPHIGEDGLLRRKGLLDYLSPNKENKIIHKSCGTKSSKGEYEDGTVDYLCPICDVTFLDNDEQTIIS